MSVSEDTIESFWKAVVTTIILLLAGFTLAYLARQQERLEAQEQQLLVLNLEAQTAVAITSEMITLMGRCFDEMEP